MSRVTGDIQIKNGDYLQYLNCTDKKGYLQNDGVFCGFLGDSVSPSAGKGNEFLKAVKGWNVINNITII